MNPDPGVIELNTQIGRPMNEDSNLFVFWPPAVKWFI